MNTIIILIHSFVNLFEPEEKLPNYEPLGTTPKIQSTVKGGGNFNEVFLNAKRQLDEIQR